MAPDRASAEPALTAAESTALGGGELVDNFGLYARHSSPQTELYWVKAWSRDRLIGAVPVVRLIRRKTTDMLRRPLRRWLGPLLGPLARKTSLLVDTSFLAYDSQSPFLSVWGADRTAIKHTISAFLKSQRRVDSIWIAEPPEEAGWAADEGYRQFQTLPMVHVELDGLQTLDDYAAALSKKRRRNFRHERDVFSAAGATIETHAGPFGDDAALTGELLACLAASAEHSQFTVPYNDVLTDPRAFAEQPQTALVARVDGRVAGFMSFLQHGDRLMQCHGGLDYARSHEVLAYHNLIYAAIELAIGRGCRLLSMGPLNNETKRRAGSTLRPIVASLWNRNPIDRFVANKLFVKNFEVYQGELSDDSHPVTAAPAAGPFASASS
jgi:hypothetical protein